MTQNNAIDMLLNVSKLLCDTACDLICNNIDIGKKHLTQARKELQTTIEYILEERKKELNK